MNLHDIAKEVLEVLGTGRQLDPFSKVYPDFGLKDAYNVTATVRAGREARGERPSAARSVHQPDHLVGIWRLCADLGLCLRRTVQDLPGRSRFRSSGLAEPRIEPESCSALRPRRAGMDEQALIHCIDWIAHGFEIVQSIFPNWFFSAPDTVAAYGLHGRLFIGPRHSAAARRGEWVRELSRFEIDLFRNGAHVDEGTRPTSLTGLCLRCVISPRRSRKIRLVRRSPRAKS